jgi:hypothetical protein
MITPFTTVTREGATIVELPSPSTVWPVSPHPYQARPLSR